MISFDKIQKKIDLSLDGLKEATARYRTVFVFYNLATVMIFVTLFNQEYSWQENINSIDRPYNKYVKVVGIDSDEKSFDLMRKHYAEMYFERQFFTVPLLGIKCSGSDLAIYAPLAMIIFSTWFFFTTRSENRIVISLEGDFNKIKNKSDELPIDEKDEWLLLLNYIYTGSIQRFVLNTISIKDYIKNNDPILSNEIARPILSILIWTPLLILLFVLGTDINDMIFKWETMKIHLLEFIATDFFLLSCCAMIGY
jgi:hypothetical protein